MAIVATIVLALMAAGSTTAYQWEQFQNSFPSNAYSVRRGGDRHYYCQVQDGKVQRGQAGLREPL
jgi:hypothetical protein